MEKICKLKTDEMECEDWIDCYACQHFALSYEVLDEDDGYCD